MSFRDELSNREVDGKMDVELSVIPRRNEPIPFRRVVTHALAAFSLSLGVAAGVTTESTGPRVSPPPPIQSPPVLGLDWARVTSVERPVNYAATQAATDNPNHPILRIPGQAYIVDLAPIASGGFVAVGYVPPIWTAAAWTSADASTWSLHTVDATSFSFAVALATGADGQIVAVGRSGLAPAVWTSSDGATWLRHGVATLGSVGLAERMTTVVATGTGYVAGGSAGPELSDRHARFWTSPDGASWNPVTDDPATFENAEVRSVVRFQGGFVAVGVVGSVQNPTGAVAWTSPDGLHWARVDDPSLIGGVAVSIAAAPWGGLVAVGSDLDRREGVTWNSLDGRHWMRAPSELSRQYPVDL